MHPPHPPLGHSRPPCAPVEQLPLPPPPPAQGPLPCPPGGLLGPPEAAPGPPKALPRAPQAACPQAQQRWLHYPQRGLHQVQGSALPSCRCPRRQQHWTCGVHQVLRHPHHRRSLCPWGPVHTWRLPPPPPHPLLGRGLHFRLDSRIHCPPPCRLRQQRPHKPPPLLQKRPARRPASHPRAGACLEERDAAPGIALQGACQSLSDRCMSVAHRLPLSCRPPRVTLGHWGRGRREGISAHPRGCTACWQVSNAWSPQGCAVRRPWGRPRPQCAG
mmetsp:Transcript_45257/g.76271  ORF Transcript_45257/g.76271 Transcript_45257/m.76271 type:complete len:273 (+) Transcript_45257:1382-2200(+)